MHAKKTSFAGFIYLKSLCAACCLTCLLMLIPDGAKLNELYILHIVALNLRRIHVACANVLLYTSAVVVVYYVRARCRKQIFMIVKLQDVEILSNCSHTPQHLDEYIPSIAFCPFASKLHFVLL